MITNDKCRFVYIAIPRTGTTAATKALLELPGSIEVKPKHSTVIPFSCRGYAILAGHRNPFEREYSSYCHCLENDPPSKEKQQACGMTFSQFVEARTAGNLFASHKSACDMVAHLDVFAWLPFDTFPQCLVDVIENLTRHRIHVEHLNQSTRGNWRDAYDEQTAQRIVTWAAKDFKQFGYDPEGWKK